MTTHRRLAAVLLLAAPLLFAGADSAELPSPAQLHALADAGQYHEALKQILRIVTLSGPAAAAYDRYDLFMLRGECQLQVHQQPAALASLALAKKQAVTQQKYDLLVAPTALTYLVQHSSAYQYTPKAPGSQKPIPWLDRTHRPEAYAALFADDFPLAAKQTAAIAKTKSIPPLEEVARLVGSIHALEAMAAGPDGHTPRTDPLVLAVATKAQELFDASLADLSAKTSTIAENANQLVVITVPVYDHISRRSSTAQQTKRCGPTGQETQFLQNAQALCNKIAVSVANMTESLSGQPEPLKATFAKAATLHQRIQTILTDNYNDTTVRNP